MVQKSNVAVFSKSYCPYCKLAKDVLDTAGVKASVMELDLRPDGSDIQNELQRLTGQATVPHVFIKEVFVGGGTDVEKLHKSGRLEKLLSKC